MTDHLETLQILLLRAADLTQDQVVDVLRCGKQKVVEAEKWARDTDIDTLRGLVTDKYIRIILDRGFEGIRKGEAEDLALDKITAEEILLRYGHVPLRQEELSRRHRERLLALIRTFADQLEIPELEDLFSLDTLSYTKLQQGDTWLEWSLARISSLRVVFSADGDAQTGNTCVTLPVETEILFSHLLTHLDSEMDEFGGLWLSYQTRLGELVGACRERMEKVVAACSSITGLDYTTSNVATGLYATAPAYICLRALDQVTAGQTGMIRAYQVPRGDWHMVPNDRSGWLLANGMDGQHMERCRDVLEALIEAHTNAPVWEQLRARHQELQQDAQILQQFLYGLIEKGDIAGDCPVCP